MIGTYRSVDSTRPEQNSSLQTSNRQRNSEKVQNEESHRREQSQAEVNSLLVSESRGEESSNRGEDDVRSKVKRRQSSSLKFRDSEDDLSIPSAIVHRHRVCTKWNHLEMSVENVNETV